LDGSGPDVAEITVIRLAHTGLIERTSAFSGSASGVSTRGLEGKGSWTFAARPGELALDILDAGVETLVARGQFIRKATPESGPALDVVGNPIVFDLHVRGLQVRARGLPPIDRHRPTVVPSDGLEKVISQPFDIDGRNRRGLRICCGKRFVCLPSVGLPCLSHPRLSRRVVGWNLGLASSSFCAGNWNCLR
jgi:hypothetical protein